MPKSHSWKRPRDEEIFARWDNRPDAEFEVFGVSRGDFKKAQLKLTGRIVLPGDPSYDADRLLTNPAFNPMPAAIIYCETELDVTLALGLAQLGTMPFSVRSGGHCTAGFSSGFGILIDVRGLDQVSVDAVAQTATVGVGCDFATLNPILEAHGLHVPGGECETVCVGGYVQGGGIGFTSGTFGMNCDNVLSLRVLLADGYIVTASATQNVDLWWAMRGGTGGNFGILLEVVYQLYPLGDVTGFGYAWTLNSPAEVAQAADVMMMLQDKYMGPNAAFGDNLTVQMLLVFQTELIKGQPMANPGFVFMVRGLWVGDPGQAATAMQPLASMPGAVQQFAITASYTTVLNELLGNPQDQPIVPQGMPNEDKASRYVAKPISKADWIQIIDMIVSISPNTMTYMYLEIYGGKICSYPTANSAFTHRDVLYNAVLDVFWYTPQERAASEQFLNEWTKVFETIWNQRVYQNYPSINVPNYPLNYWGSALDGLRLVKQKYDANNVFQFAQQVPMPLTGEVIDRSDVPPKVAAALDQPVDTTGGVKLALAN